MKRLLFSSVFSIFCLANTTAFSQENFQDLQSGKMFPKEVEVKHDGKSYTLKATGATTRKKYIIQIYSIASYIDNPSRTEGVKQMLDPNKTKQVTQIYLHDIDQKKMTDFLNESISKNIPAEQDLELRPLVNDFLSFYKGVKVNDKHETRWYPGGEVEFYINGKLIGTIKSEKFALALWKLWFGDNSIVNRDEMVTFP